MDLIYSENGLGIVICSLEMPSIYRLQAKSTCHPRRFSPGGLWEDSVRRQREFCITKDEAPLVVVVESSSCRRPRLHDISLVVFRQQRLR